MIHYKTLLLIVIGFLSINTYGQSFYGVIVDADQIPVIGAQVLNLENNEHSHSDENGYFELMNVSIGDSLKVTHLTYEPSVVVVQLLGESITIKMKDLSISLSEIVITPQVNPLYVINQLDLKNNPVSSSQDILKNVPGLVLGHTQVVIKLNKYF